MLTQLSKLKTSILYCLLLSLWTFCAVLRTTLCAVCYASGIKSTTNDVITYTWEVFYTTTTYQYDRVFLKVVSFSWNVGVYFLLVCQTNTGNLTHCRIRLLRGGGVNTYTNAATLRATVQSRALALVDKFCSSFSN